MYKIQFYLHGDVTHSAQLTTYILLNMILNHFPHLHRIHDTGLSSEIYSHTEDWLECLEHSSD